MKKSKILSVILAGLATIGLTFSMTACGPNGGNGSIKVDETKTQLTVKYYGAGFGNDWMNEYIKRFEDKYKDYKNGDRVGVQVIPDNAMIKYTTASELESNAYDVYFLEGVDFAALAKAGAFEDISGIVTGENSDGKTIESKLDDTQRDYYTVNGKYYGLPHYTGAYGIVYNVDLFEQNNLYIKKGYSGRMDFLIKNANDEKSAGPDGEYGTYDDGIPATYDEFFMLCDEIRGKDMIPICFTGQYKWDYTAKFMDNLVSNYNGVADQKLYYSYSGTATKLVKMNGSGKVDLSSGKVQLESKEITTATGYELAREAGIYYAADFLERLAKGGVNNPEYVMEDSFGEIFTHKQAQKAFLNNESLMLIDGDWWLTEAGSSISAADKKTRKFGWMPLPHATSEQVGEKQVYTDNMASCAAVRAGLSDVSKELALNFIKDFYTDDNLVEFTKTTNTFIGVNYKAALEAAKSELTPYAVSLNNYIQNADVMYQISNVNFFNLNYTKLQSVQYYIVGNKNKQPLQYMIEDCKNSSDMSKDYFEAFYAGMKEDTIWK